MSKQEQIGKTLQISWGVSRGRGTEGYTTCSLRNQDGRRVAYCNGGGYDMRGTVVGHWVAAAFKKELCALKPEDMPGRSHWEGERARVCDGACKEQARDQWVKDWKEDESKPYPELPKLEDDCFECPVCKGPTVGSRDGKTVQDGRSFYGLSFYDPNYDVMTARLERCDDTFTKPEDVGKTFRELEKEGKIIDLDVLRRWHKETSKHATERHTVPTIDGACGFSCVMDILKALGLTLRQVVNTKRLDVYVIEEIKELQPA
jgi:hypothetical protein